MIDKMLKIAKRLESRAQVPETVQTNINNIFDPLKEGFNKSIQDWALKSNFRGTVSGKINCGWVPTKQGNKIVCNNVQFSFVPTASLTDAQKTVINSIVSKKNAVGKALLEKAFNQGGAFQNEYNNEDKLNKPDGCFVVEINFDLSD